MNGSEIRFFLGDTKKSYRRFVHIPPASPPKNFIIIIPILNRT